MWRITKKYIMPVLLAVLFLSFSSVGSCSEAVAGTEEDMILVSRKDWNELKQNNAAQAKALSESQAELSEVKKAQAESERALIEAQTLLETSTMTSEEMTKLCATLLTELNLQKAENAKLMQELKDAKAESLTASDAILKANQFLADTKKEIEAREAEWRKRENQLERQRLEWQILFALAVCGGVALAA